jgi:SPP1 family predicted phage head-tail adaptor
MNTGPMRHRVDFEALTEQKDQHSAIKNVWVKVCDARTRIIPLTGRSLFAAQKEHSEVTGRIEMRYRADITAKMRGVFNGKIYSIHAAINVEERNKDLHLMVSEGVREN